MNNRYSRHISLKEVGDQGQDRLLKKTIFILGLGGIGSPAALYLASSGIGRLVLNDFDLIDESNLSRQILFNESDLGNLKVDVVKKKLNAINSNLKVDTIDEKLSVNEYSKIISKTSFVLDCSDNFETRLSISQAAYESNIPIIHGSAIRFEGQLVVFLNNGKGPCYSCVYSDNEWLENCQGNGVLSTVPGLIGLMMTSELLKIIFGIKSQLVNILLLWDFKDNTWKKLNIKPNPNCKICSRC